MRLPIELRSTAILLMALVLTGCPDGNPFGDGPPTIEVTLTNLSGNVSVGNPYQVTARSTSSQFGQPAFQLLNLPAGVTHVGNLQQIDPSTYDWAVTLTADATASPGTTTITFRSSRSGGEGTADFQLTVQ